MIYDLVLSHHSLLVTELWLRALPLFSSLFLPLFLSPLTLSSLSLPPPPSLSLSLCPLCSVAHRGPRAPPFSASGALLCTCDIGGMRVWLWACIYVHVYGCVLGHVRGVTHMI